MKEQVVFTSVQREFAVPLPAIKATSTAGGKIVSSHFTPGHIKFKEWTYKTSKLAEIELLRGILKTYAKNGLTPPFSEVALGESSIKATGRKPLQSSQNLSAKTKNDVIAHLVLSFGVQAKELADKELDDLLVFAQVNYNCKFPNAKVKKEKVKKEQTVSIEPEKTNTDGSGAKKDLGSDMNPNTSSNEQYLEDPLAVKVTGITAKNDALAYLKKEKNVSAAVLKKLKFPGDIKEFAFNQHKIVFVDWV